jgi:hypothetical protein
VFPTGKTILEQSGLGNMGWQWRCRGGKSAEQRCVLGNVVSGRAAGLMVVHGLPLLKKMWLHLHPLWFPYDERQNRKSARCHGEAESTSQIAGNRVSTLR